MAHVTLVEHPHGLVGRFAFRFTNKRFGRMVEPTAAAAHHNGVLAAMGALEMTVERSWRRLDLELRGLVLQLAAARIGCSWCQDYGFFESVNRGASPEKIRAVDSFRTSDLFDDRERAALEYTEAATATPVVVDDELVARLHRLFSEAELVELAGWVALENFRSRFNGGLGLRSQGFADSCEVPLRQSAAL